MGEELAPCRCVIVAGGEILDYAAVSAALRPGDVIFCADSGYRHCQLLGVTPALLVGDFDSIGHVPPAIPLLTLPPDKDYTDTTLAAEEAVNRGYRSLLFAGMMGGRPDHTLANLQTMVGLSRRSVAVSLTDGITDMIAFTAPTQGCELILPCRKDHYFSLFAMSSLCRRVSILGGKYPLQDYDLRFDEARAVSNEFVGEDVVVTMGEGSLLVVTAREGSAPTIR
jgi:thiamine pyrophosphokinase